MTNNTRNSLDYSKKYEHLVEIGALTEEQKRKIVNEISVYIKQCLCGEGFITTNTLASISLQCFMLFNPNPNEICIREMERTKQKIFWRKSFLNYKNQQ